MKIDPKQIAKMITEDPDEVHETMNESHDDYLDHRTDTVENVQLGPWLPAKPSDSENPLDDMTTSFDRGYDIKYEWTVRYYPEEPQTINYPGAPAYEEIEDVSVSEITHNGRSLLWTTGSSQGVIEAAEAYFWEVLSQEL
tara:strand:- start:851 stop:1270 length:420 start_codon:yes stop_codon:yes gene_type:complete